MENYLELIFEDIFLPMHYLDHHASVSWPCIRKMIFWQPSGEIANQAEHNELVVTNDVFFALVWPF